MNEPIVIIGGGIAAGTAAIELRENGYNGDLILYADEPHPPYERPPLSKGYLAGKAEAEDAYVRPPSWYAENNVDLRTGTRVANIELGDKVVHASDGVQKFSRLLIATGAKPRSLPILDTDDITVGYLRSLTDARLLRERLTPDTRLLVVGGGWIGMEVAATSRQIGIEVTLVEPGRQPLLRALGPDIARRVAQVHTRNGVALRTSTSVEHLRDGRAVLSDGTEIQVNTVLIGIGATPNDSLAHLAGLDVNNGILVDAGLGTSHPDVFAAGDVANQAHPLLNEQVRVEHWQNAVSQGRAAAHGLLGVPVTYDEIPSFFSDQYDLGMEYFGYPGVLGTDAVRIEPVSGDDPQALTAWWYRDERLVAAMHINQWDRSEELKERVRMGR